MRTEPDNADWAGLVAGPYLDQSGYLLVAGEPAAAAAPARTGCRIADRLVARDATVRAWRVDLRGLCLGVRARLALARGGDAEARSLARQAVALARSEHGAAPSAETRLALATALKCWRGSSASADRPAAARARPLAGRLSAWPRAMRLPPRALAAARHHARRRLAARRPPRRLPPTSNGSGFRHPTYLNDRSIGEHTIEEETVMPDPKRVRTSTSYSPRCKASPEWPDGIKFELSSAISGAGRQADVQQPWQAGFPAAISTSSTMSKTGFLFPDDEDSGDVGIAGRGRHRCLVPENRVTLAEPSKRPTIADRESGRCAVTNHERLQELFKFTLLFTRRRARTGRASSSTPSATIATVSRCRQMRCWRPEQAWSRSRWAWWPSSASERAGAESPRRAPIAA